MLADVFKCARRSGIVETADTLVFSEDSMNLLDREGMHWWEREEGGQATLLIDKVVGSRKGSRWGTKEALKKERPAERTMLVHLNAEDGCCSHQGERGAV